MRELIRFFEFDQGLNQFQFKRVIKLVKDRHFGYASDRQYYEIRQNSYVRSSQSILLDIFALKELVTRLNECLKLIENKTLLKIKEPKMWYHKTKWTSLFPLVLCDECFKNLKETKELKKKDFKSKNYKCDNNYCAKGPCSYCSRRYTFIAYENKTQKLR